MKYLDRLNVPHYDSLDEAINDVKTDIKIILKNDENDKKKVMQG